MHDASLLHSGSGAVFVFHVTPRLMRFLLPLFSFVLLSFVDPYGRDPVVLCKYIATEGECARFSLCSVCALRAQYSEHV